MLIVLGRRWRRANWYRSQVGWAIFSVTYSDTFQVENCTISSRSAALRLFFPASSHILQDDLKSWYPELSNKIKITLIEALPSVLSMFSRELIDYTVSTFKESKIDIMTGTMVKAIKDKSVVLQMPDKSIKEVPVGMVLWAGGNKPREVSVDLMSRLPDAQKNKRGITVDGRVDVPCAHPVI